MGIWNSKKQPDSNGSELDRLREIASKKVEAATKLTAALIKAGSALEALFEADREFCAEWNQRHGDWGHGTARLMRQLRPMLLADLELSAPELLRYLDQPRQSRAKAETIASLIARQVDSDLATEPARKEQAA